MKTQIQTVRMGEIRVGQAGQTLGTLLGSCVGVLLFDEARSMAALAHIQLPNSLIHDSRASETPGAYADTAILDLLRRMQSPDGADQQLVAHMAGGAEMFAATHSMKVGEQNIAATSRALSKSNVVIASSHCGGNRARRLQFEVGTGDLTIEVIDSVSYGSTRQEPRWPETSQ